MEEKKPVTSMEEDNNMDADIEAEEAKQVFEISAASLHILDYSANVKMVSQGILDLADEVNAGLVKRCLRRGHKDPNGHEGKFREESGLLAVVKQHLMERTPAAAYGAALAEYIDTCLKSRTVKTIDVLTAEYRYEEVPYTLITLLEGESAYTPKSEKDNGITRNTIVESRGILPHTSKRLSTYAVINELTYGIRYNDEIKWDNAEKEMMKNVILNCEAGKSSAEVLKTVQEVTADVADTFHENPGILVSKVKQKIAEAGEEERYVTPEELAADVFADYAQEEEMQKAFLKQTEEKNVPKEAEIEPAAVSRRLKSQKIRTDTGIEISFPTEYFEKPEMISFVNEDDGSISITIKHISRITNR